MDSKNYSIELTRFFDKIRYLRHMTQAELVGDVVSLRQFRRYLNGTYIMPQYVINAFSARLGFKPEYIVLEFESDKKRETQNLNEFHNLIVTNNLVAAKDMLKRDIFKFVLDYNNQIFFQYTMILFKFYTKEISEAVAVVQTKQLINYEKVLNNDVFSSTEIIILTSLMGYPSFDEKERLVKLFEKYMLDPSLVISGNNITNILLCMNYIIEFYGMNENYEKVITLSNQAIGFAMKAKTFYLLVDFYYYLALAYYALKDTISYEASLFHCYNALHMENNSSKTKKYYKLIEADFGINLNKFAMNHIHVMDTITNNHDC